MGKITTKSREFPAWCKELVMAKTVTIDSGALDAGNTGQTHILREGLVLGIISAQGTYVEYDADGTDDGRRDAYCILLHQVDLKDGDPTASASDHEAAVMWIGTAVSDHCIGYDAGCIADLAKNAALVNGWIEFDAA